MEAVFSFLQGLFFKVSENYLHLLLLAILAPLYGAVRLVKVARRLRASGVRYVYPNRENYTKDRRKSFEEYIKSAKVSFLYFGHWLAVSLDQQNTLNSLAELLHKRRRVTIIMVASNSGQDVINYYSELYGDPEEEIVAQLKRNWENVIAWRAQLSARQRECLSLRSHKNKVSFSAFSFDADLPENHILIDQKIWGLKRRDSYGLELCAKLGGEKDKALHSRYYRSLQVLFDSSEEIEVD